MTDRDRIAALERAGKLVVSGQSDLHLRLSNPETLCAVQYYPTKGTIVRVNVKQLRRGLDEALKLIGVSAA